MRDAEETEKSCISFRELCLYCKKLQRSGEGETVMRSKKFQMKMHLGTLLAAQRATREVGQAAGSCYSP